MTVSGVQPFKALIDGRSLSSYNIYWQVDGGQANLLGDSYDGTPHKESLVDLSGWHWRANGQYTITFTAKDTAGAILANKTVIINVAN